MDPRTARSLIESVRTQVGTRLFDDIAKELKRQKVNPTVFEGAEFNREQHTCTREDLLRYACDLGDACPICSNSDMEDAIVKLLEEIKDIVERRCELMPPARTPVRE